MYIEERPIESKKQDLFGRARFAGELADSFSSWKDKGSLVVGLYGKWGSGKSSVLNLVRERLSDGQKDKSPTLIEFNPWMVSGQPELYGHFFNEISSALELQDDYELDRSLAIRLRAYGRLLGSVPEPSSIAVPIKQFALGSGILGVLISQFLPGMAQIIVLGCSVALLSLRLFGSLLNSLAEFVDERLKLKEKSLASMKKAIVDELSNREKKLLIVLDDIDRLSQNEIKLIFQLVKVNSDFPNTIFLLAFDRPVVEKQLRQSEEVSGRNFLEKIVQVHFDIPNASRKRAEEYLFSQLDATLESLPENSQKLFDSSRWGNIYHSGFGQLFESMRHIKRYINSLRFNFGMLVNSGTLEVNPIDFMAIEAIRVFAPDYYEYMKNNKALYTHLDSGVTSAYSGREKESRQNLASASLDLIDNDHRDQVRGILNSIFPGVFDNVTYNESYWSRWSRELRAAHPDFYDIYFSLTPGGYDGYESNVSQFEIDVILASIHDKDELLAKFRAAIATQKIRQVLQRLQSYASDKESIPRRDYASLIQVLFDIAEELPTDETSIWDTGALMDVQRIMFQLAKREDDAAFFGAILKECIESAASLPAAIETVSLATPREGDEPREFRRVMVNADDLDSLQQVCVKKIELAHADGTLFESSRLLYILYRWREWSTDDPHIAAVNGWISDDEGLVEFLQKFFYVQKSYTMTEFIPHHEDAFNFRELCDFVGIEGVRDRIRRVAKTDGELYRDNRKVIALFLAGVDKYIPVEGADDVTGEVASP